MCDSDFSMLILVATLQWDITRRYFELLRDYPAPAIKCIISHSFKFLHNEWAVREDAQPDVLS